MEIPNLLPNCFIVTAEIINETMDAVEANVEPIETYKSNVPSAFVMGLAYTSAVGDGASMVPDQLANIPVGVQDTAISGMVILAEGKELNLSDNLSDNSGNSGNSNSPFSEDTVKVISKHQKMNAKEIAYDAQKKRVSRRLLLAERAKQLTVVCPDTGVVSLLDIPAIPFPRSNPQLAKALVWSSPLSDLANCRGLAQQGIDYLRRLDTQTLAGILIVLAGAYDLFKFQPFDSGAQKNAILRTAGKDHIIDCIILIEGTVHSGNAGYLPKLSLVFDSNLEQYGLEVRMHSYIRMLAEAVAKPDKEAYDDKKVLPLYPIKPVYTKDVEASKQKVSFLARQEQARAKKEFAEDKKAGKLALAQMRVQVTMTDKLKNLLASMFADDGMLVMPPAFLEMIITKLSTSFADNGNAQKIIAILKKDRKALKLDLAEIEADIASKQQAEEPEKEMEQDDPAPGQEAAVIEIHINDEEEDGELDFNTETNAYEPKKIESQEEPKQEEIEAPAGLTAWEQILWKKKMAKASGVTRNVVQNDLPSVTTYTPSTTKTKLGE